MSVDIETMSLIELKKLAKTKKIKQYYIMKRAELIELLMMEELPFKLRLEKMTISEMRAIAKQRGMRGFWSLSKDQLCDKLFGGSSHDEKKDDSKASEHKDPKYKDSYEVRVDVTEYSLEERFDNMSL
jgi:hypothetical protein